MLHQKRINWEVIAGPSSRRPFGRTLKSFQIPGSSGPRKLLKAEEKLFDTITSKDCAEYCVLSKSIPAVLNEDNRVRASFLRFLALGGDDEICTLDQGVKLYGAYIDGDLTFDGCDYVNHITLDNCMLPKAILFSNTTTKGLNLTGSKVALIKLYNTAALGDIILEHGFYASDGVDIINCQLVGALSLQNASILGTAVSGLRCSNSTIRQVSLTAGFRAELVKFVNCHIYGDLLFSDANIENTKEAEAIVIERTSIGGTVIFSGAFRCLGCVTFRSSTLNGDLDFVSGEFCSKGFNVTNLRQDSHLSTFAIDISGTKIAGDLRLGNSATVPGTLVIDGSLNFRDVRVQGSYYDREDLWPAESKQIEDRRAQNAWFLDGFEYSRAHEDAAFDVATRTRWLLRQPAVPNDIGVAYQPIAFLSSYLNSKGLAKDASRITILRERLHRAKTLRHASPLHKLWLWSFGNS